MSGDPAAGAGSGEPEASSGCDLEPELQAEIRDFARELPEMTYHEILGVERDADTAAVRRAFFQRSKRFHPDRYFNRDLGAYERLLHEIYKRVVAAHEVLRDEQLRPQYEQALKAPKPRSASSKKKLLGLPGAPKADKRTLRDRLGLQNRNTVLYDLQARLERSRNRGREHFEAAEAERERGDWVRAASLVRLALAFDPREPEYHEALADVLPRAQAEQAEASRAKGDLLLARGRHEEALEFLEEAFRLTPTDAELGHAVAGMLRDSGELERALETASQAVELEEKNVAYRKTLGMILIDMGRKAEARKELQRVWEMDPMDRDVKNALSVL